MDDTRTRNLNLPGHLPQYATVYCWQIRMAYEQKIGLWIGNRSYADAAQELQDRLGMAEAADFIRGFTTTDGG